jgi:hypothetical protein
MSPQKLREMLQNPTFRKRNSHLVNPSPGNPTPNPVPERPVQHGAIPEAQGKAENPGRLRVRVVCHRKRLIDPDNLCPKYFIDCLRYAGAIPDDTAQAIELTITQQKSGKDMTLLEVETIP